MSIKNNNFCNFDNNFDNNNYNDNYDNDNSDNNIFMHDSIYGIVELSEISQKIINHPFFQRLRKIHQLGSLYFKNKNADHKRYEHSIGVAYLSKIAIDALSKNINISHNEKLCVEIAGLCHDIGHGTYSHSFDNLLEEIGIDNKYSIHEVRSMFITEYIIKDLQLELSVTQIELIKYFIDTKKYMKYFNENYHEYFESKKINYTKGIEQIVNNNICYLDVDKMDYILRDSQKLGIYNNNEFNIIEVLNNSTIINEVWCFNIKDYTFIYDLICQRFVLYSRYYLNNEAMIFAHMITNSIRMTNYHERFLNCINDFENIQNLYKFCELTDEFIENLILNKTDTNLNKAKKIMVKVMKCEPIYNYLMDFIISKDGEIITIQNDDETNSEINNQNKLNNETNSEHKINNETTNEITNENKINNETTNENNTNKNKRKIKSKNKLVYKNNIYIDNKIMSDKSNPDNMINNIKFHINNQLTSINKIKGLRTLYQKIKL
jgi:HD superfamily phosphohydrolase